jgi:hypothetical protein
MKRPILATAAVVCATLLIAVGGCSYVVTGYERAFETTADGDTLGQVLSRFGEPGVREQPGAPFLRYATAPCNGGCSVRLWWEHPVLRGLEAWSVDLDRTGRVVHKAHWVSP